MIANIRFQAIEGRYLQDYLNKSSNQIEEIVELVRGTLTQMTRISLGALIVMDVHGMKFYLTIICFFSISI